MGELVSIITINLNNLDGLRKTVQSVLIQEYSNFEFLIIDGGSTDGSVSYINSIENRIEYWISEKDNGIYDAMNKGVCKSLGQYVLFLNSGDYFYDKFSLSRLCEGGRNAGIIYGNMVLESGHAVEFKKYPSKLDFTYFIHDTLPHPSTLIRRDLFMKYGKYSTSYSIVSDWAFFLDTIIGGNVTYQYVNTTVSVFNLQGISSQPGSYAIIRKEMDHYLSAHYRLYYMYYKVWWSIRYYPKRIMQKIGLIPEYN